MASLPAESSREIAVEKFVPSDQIDPMLFEKSYYLEPEKTGTKPYVLLRDALEQSGRVGLVKIALRSREALATLRVRDGVFVLETMMWPDEVREADFGFLDDEIEVRQQEVQMALSLIETLSGDFDPSQYSDAYREALEAVIDAKVAGREIVAPSAAPVASGQVVDLMAALQASVDAARRNRAGGGTAQEISTASHTGEGDGAGATRTAAGKAASKPATRAATKPATKAATKPTTKPATKAATSAAAKAAPAKGAKATAAKRGAKASTAADAAKTRRKSA
jgi:DNA end-binding protein Ku